MLVAVSLLITWWWSYRERQLTHDGRAQLEVLSELGDVVPPSLHPVVDPLRCIGSGSCVQDALAVGFTSLLQSWRAFHRMLAVLLILLVPIHVGVAWLYGYRWIFE